ncbi:unnamed protein product [Anisakis simplex]|uniref:Piezo_RRas_bdg domain-containing protein n=1 Tax=Anisakis simplex TaxID=6269 RepID=A0A0M3J222_ANISI|nr:unnamed protein product [Anisakis simplex]
MRHLDGCQLSAMPQRCIRRLSVSFESGRTYEWITPFVCLFACILYVCFYYLYLLIYGDWPALKPEEWISKEAGELIVALWLPILFILLLIFVHMKKFETSLDITLHPSSPISQTVFVHYDTILSLSICIFAACNISVIGLLLMLLSLLIFISKPKICRVASCIASILLALIWLFSFLSSAMQLPVLVFPESCQQAFVIDRNTAQWLGFWPAQTWPVIVLLFMISMRPAVAVDKSQWLSEIKRVDAEKDITSLMKYLAKYWMHKFGVEASLICGLILACIHKDIFGLFLLISVLLLRIFARHRQALLWAAYTRTLLAVLIVEYVSTLGTPHQFSKCFLQFWSVWPKSIKRYFLLPSSASSNPIIIFDYILVLFLFVQKDVFGRDDDHPGGDNTPLSDPHQPIPPMYKDFISTKGYLSSYCIILEILSSVQMVPT